LRVVRNGWASKAIGFVRAHAIGLLIGFLGFLGGVFATVAVVAVVQDDWSEARWAGVAALAAVVQAIGVIAALFYAKRQIDLSRHQRREVLIKELGGICKELLRAARDLLNAWNSLIHTPELASEHLGSNEQIDVLIRQWFDDSKERVRVAEATISGAASEVRETLQLLGTGTPRCLLVLEISADGLSTYGLPDLGEPIDASHEKKDMVARVEKAAADFRGWLHDYVENHVSAG
jgi:hypothetical protein